MHALRWTPCWEQDPPEGTRVLVKVRHPNGEFGEDIGLRPFAGEWQLQSFKTSVPVAWALLPV